MTEGRAKAFKAIKLGPTLDAPAPPDLDSPSALSALIDLVQGKRVLVLTGAGCSTESGIPDYRGPGTRARARNPIQHREFVTNPTARVRYWARSAVGWPRFSAFTPNPAHEALAVLEREGWVDGVLTQNVDRLHQRAGSRDVVELHGALEDVRCLDCLAHETRDSLQGRLLELNSDFIQRPFELAPDGDAELPLEALERFQVPGCLACSGVLKPDVVFFGDHVPQPRLQRAFAMLERANVLLVVGTSLAVYSGYRFVLKAAERNMAVAIVNLGETRGDPHAHLLVEGTAGTVLPALRDALNSSR